MVTARPGAVSAAMELALPASRCSEAATVALGHLRGVEKQLQNEGLVFDKGTVQHLEDAIEAVKKLEEERKHTLELLEEETIKNCNLRAKVKGIPELVMKEFEELVNAARRSRCSKITEIEVSIYEMVSAIEGTYSKQHLSEERNLALCEEQKEFGVKHEEAVDLLNQQMAAKHSFYLQINELHNQQKDEEEETTWQTQVIQELEKQMAQEVSEFEEKQRLLDSQIAELQKQLKAQRLKMSQKRMDYQALLAILQALQKQIEEKEQAIATGRDELAKLFEKIKSLLKEHENKKAEKQRIIQQRAELQNTMASLELRFREKKEALLQQLAEAEQQLESITRVNKRLRNENKLLKTQQEALVEEERGFSSRRNELAKEFERLSNEVTEKLDRLTKRLVEIQNLEEEREKLQDMLDTTEDSCQREIETLESILQREFDRSKMLQEQLDEILAQYKKLQSNHSGLMSGTHHKTEAAQRTLLDLMKQNEALKKEMERSEMNIKILSDKLSKKAAWYKQFDDGITAELKKLEDEYHAKLKLLQEKEEKLGVVLPFSEKLNMRFRETSVAYEDRKDFYTGLHEEENTLSKSIVRSLKEIARLRRMKTHLRGEINAQRETARQQLFSFSESLKFLERDNYEANRKLYIVNAENARFREAIAHLRAEISTLESEEETYRSKRQQAQEEMRALHDIFDQRWSQDKHLWQLFLKGERKVLKALEEQMESFKKRNKAVNYVSNGLQLNYEGVVSLIKSKPSIEESSPAVSSITA